MVVRVLVVGLDSIVVHVGDRKLGLNPLDPDSLELQVDHSSCGVLGQSLVNLNGNLLASLHLAGYKVLLDDFVPSSSNNR